ncbi:MAG: PEGA domain-containing protein [Gammaproteobacteria bacterium]|nr:PEGA domain-containing protein [Gammaproteobacteria bacterium]
MYLRYAAKLALLIILLALTACSDKPQEISIDINATFNGKPISGAQVSIDENNSGQTDDRGRFQTVILRKVTSNISIKVNKDINGYRVTPWEKQFTYTKTSGETFSLLADIKGTPFVTVKVLDGKTPIENARIKLSKELIGKTDKEGLFIYDIPVIDNEKRTLQITKYGHETWKKQLPLVPGETIEASIPKQLILSVSALTEKFDDTIKLEGAQVFLGKKLLGKTNKDGVFRIVRKGNKGKTAELTVKVPGHLPESWTIPVKLTGEIKLKHYFYPTKQEPARVAFFRFVSNTAGEDIGNIPARFQKDLQKRISSLKGYKTVDQETMMQLFKQAKLTPDDAMQKGWKNTDLEKEVDIIVFGSVTKDVKGRFIAEANFYKSDGGVAFSQLATAKNADNIDRAAKEIVVNVEESFPIIGSLIAQKNDVFHINLGDDHTTVEDKNDFQVFNPTFDKYGKITDYKAIGSIKISDTENKYSEAKADGISKGVTPIIGAKVVRTNLLDEKNKHFVTIAAKSEIRGSIEYLSGVNVYLNEKWMGVTGKNGKVRIPIKLDKEYDLSLYKHGFSQKSEEIELAKNADFKEFLLDSYYSLLKIESEPSNATVYIDGATLGTTPFTDGKPVSTGFHTVRISAGGDYRDWEEVIEFTNSDMNWTGDQSILFQKDLLRLGTQAANSGKIDDAIALYSQADKDHPDYAEIHHNLAQLYLDDKHNPDAAIVEFEKVVAIPEIRELIYKQFSIAYTNLGHAYHEKANSVLHKDKKNAAQFLAKSIKTLNRAKENARFFPNEYYDEAVHDTYYYIALSYHKLYQLSNKSSVLDKAERAWRDYIDFFPPKLMSNPDFVVSRESADTFMEQLNKN